MINNNTTWLTALVNLLLFNKAIAAKTSDIVIYLKSQLQVYGYLITKAMQVKSIVVKADKLKSSKIIKGLFGVADCPNAIAMAFITVNFCEIACAINMRSQHNSIFSKNMFKNYNWWLAGSTIITVALTLAAIYIPGMCQIFGIIPGTFEVKELIICIALSISVFPVFEIGKGIRNSVRNRHDF